MSVSGQILLYHRVAALDSDPHRINVDPERFRQHLELLTKRYRPLSLTSLVEHSMNRSLPDRAVAVTFDDGYADMAIEALPLLLEFGVPATVFVATANVGTTREFWWDRLEALLLTPGDLPEWLSIRIGWKRIREELGESSEYTEADARRHAGWSSRTDPAPTERHGLLQTLFKLIIRLDPKKIEAVLVKLEAWAGREPSKRATHRALSEDEVAALVGSRIVEVGAHTVNHPRLSRLSSTARRREIVASQRRLEELVGPVTQFAYPFGDDHRSVGTVRHLGFDVACTTRPGRVTADTDPFRLPRSYVGDWEADRLEEVLEA